MEKSGGLQPQTSHSCDIEIPLHQHRPGPATQSHHKPNRLQRTEMQWHITAVRRLRLRVSAMASLPALCPHPAPVPAPQRLCGCKPPDRRPPPRSAKLRHPAQVRRHLYGMPTVTADNRPPAPPERQNYRDSAVCTAMRCLKWTGSVEKRLTRNAWLKRITRNAWQWRRVKLNTREWKPQHELIVKTSIKTPDSYDIDSLQEFAETEIIT